MVLCDSFGAYEIISGHEGTGRCWWCGELFPDKRARRFCSRSCRSRYEVRFYWNWAARAAMNRARYRCQECGKKGKRRLQVHHIIPLNGGNRIKNELNRQDNLVVLCRECHRKRHNTKNPEG